MQNIKKTLEGIRKEAAETLTPGKARAVWNHCDRIDLTMRKASPAVGSAITAKRKPNKYGINPATGKPFLAQWDVIFHYLTEKPGRTITQREASADFGFSDLAGVIRRIEDRTGIRAARREINVPTRYGGVTGVKQYWIDLQEAKKETAKQITR